MSSVIISRDYGNNILSNLMHDNNLITLRTKKCFFAKKRTEELSTPRESHAKA